MEIFFYNMISVCFFGTEKAKQDSLDVPCWDFIDDVVIFKSFFKQKPRLVSAASSIKDKCTYKISCYLLRYIESVQVSSSGYVYCLYFMF